MRRKSVVVTATVLIVGVLVPADIVASIDYKLWVNSEIVINLQFGMKITTLKLLSKQVLGNAVRILLHIWGIWLCCFFLYLGVKIMTLVKRMPKSVLQNFDSRHKGKCIIIL